MTNKNDRFMGQPPAYCITHKEYYFIVCVPCSLANKAALESTAEAMQKERAALRQRIDSAHKEIYSVWNGCDRLTAAEINSLEAALAILGHIIDQLKPAALDSQSTEAAQK